MKAMSAERLPLEPEGKIPHGTDPNQQARNENALRLLEMWSAGDEQEQKETWQFLKVALDEDRLSERRLFP